MDRLNSRAVKQTGKWELLCFCFFGLCNQITRKLAGLNWESAPRTKTRQIRIDLNGESCKVTSVMSQEQKYRAGSEFNTVSMTQITWVFKTLTFCWVCYGEDVCRFILKYWWCQGQTQSNINKVKRYSSSFWVELLTKPWFVLLCKKQKKQTKKNIQYVFVDE